MANLSKAIAQNLIDSILPTYGKIRKDVPVWDEGQKMFIHDQHISDAGNLYYRGIRFCDRVVIVENVGQYHTWTYIDGIELYAFNGTDLELIQKRDYDKVFRNAEFVRKESEAMVLDFLVGVFKSQKVSVPASDIESQANQLVDNCYKSFLDNDFDSKLTQIIPQLKTRNNK